MKKYTIQEALKIIIDASEEYEEKLNDKHFLIIYQTGKEIKTTEVGFRDINFLHLTGITTKLSASMFYSACLSHKLSIKDISLDMKGKAHQKLMVLPYLSNLLYNSCMIGDFIDSGVYIKADYFVGNTKAVLSVGFRFGKSIDFPVTLYNESIKTLVRPVNKVLAIYSKKYNESLYNICTYLSKNQDPNTFPIEVKQKIFI